MSLDRPKAVGNALEALCNSQSRKMEKYGLQGLGVMENGDRREKKCVAWEDGFAQEK